MDFTLSIITKVEIADLDKTGNCGEQFVVYESILLGKPLSEVADFMKRRVAYALAQLVCLGVQLLLGSASAPPGGSFT